MPKKETKDVALKELQLPVEYLNENGVPIGTEGISKDDMVLPTIQVIQTTSDNADLGIGKIINTISNEVSDTLDVIPLTVSKGRVCFQDKDLICRSNNGIVSVEGDLKCFECEKSHWTEGQVPPACSETRNFPIMLPDKTIAILTFKKSGLTDARHLITFIKLAKVPFFFYKVKLSSEKKEAQKGTYYALKMEYGKDSLTNDIERATALDWYKVIANKDLTVAEPFETQVLCPKCQSVMSFGGVNPQTGKDIYICSNDICGEQLLVEKKE